jgi:hypothetical protein
MKYILLCDCGSYEFEYDFDEEVYRCKKCGITYSCDQAGYELIEMEE